MKRKARDSALTSIASAIDASSADMIQLIRSFSATDEDRKQATKEIQELSEAFAKIYNAE